MVTNKKTEHYDKADPYSIFEYSGQLIGSTLREIIGESAISQQRKGKGSLGQMVEELFFKYQVNSKREADFKEAHVELKCTPVKIRTADGSISPKERVVCTMIDYFEIVDTCFEDSHLLTKCRLMLILFYLYTKGTAIYDYEFVFRVLWELPQKDLLLIKKDYETIADKVRKGQAHLISEGDTLYLGACRKGQKGDVPKDQPFSSEKALSRAFSLKPAYIRYILSHVKDLESRAYTNYGKKLHHEIELVDEDQLKVRSFEKIIQDRFTPFIGLNYIQICNKLNIEPYQTKNKYADVSNLIVSLSNTKRIAKSEEFQKSGIILKTVRLRENGMPKEAMAFKNIDYREVYENANWVDSELYEIFTSRFMFVVFKPTGDILNFINIDGETVVEPEYILDRIFFWTMPVDDLKDAERYWEHIKSCVMDNDIRLQSFWSIKDKKKFHVRPKAQTKAKSIALNPNGGTCEKYAYWFNADYVKQIIDSHSKE